MVLQEAREPRRLSACKRLPLVFSPEADPPPAESSLLALAQPGVCAEANKSPPIGFVKPTQKCS